MKRIGQELPVTIWYLAAGLFCVGAGQSIVFITIPPLARDMGLTEIQIGSIFATSALAWIILSPYWGKLSDQIGRKKVIIIGLVGFAISLILFSSTISLGQKSVITGGALFFLLILARAINGILGSATRPASGAWIADITRARDRSRAFARLDSGFSFGRIIGPAIAGFLILISYTTPFLLFGMMALIVAISISYQSTTVKPPSSKVSIKNLSLIDSSVWPFLLVSGFFGICNASLVQTASFFFEDIIIPPSGISLLGYTLDQPITFASLGFMLTALGIITGQLLIADRLKVFPGNLIRFGTLLITVSFLAISFSNSLLSIYIPLFVYGIGAGMLGPGISASLSLSVGKAHQGAASGFLGMVIPIGHIISPLVIMPLYIQAPKAPFLLGFIIMCLAIIFIQFNPRHTWIRNKGYINATETASNDTL